MIWLVIAVDPQVNEPKLIAPVSCKSLSQKQWAGKLAHSYRTSGISPPPLAAAKLARALSVVQGAALLSPDGSQDLGQTLALTSALIIFSKIKFSVEMAWPHYWKFAWFSGN